MSEERACYAVLGVEPRDARRGAGAAVGSGRHGAPDAAAPAADGCVRSIDGDNAVFAQRRHCADEVVAALARPPGPMAAALERVVQRYGRAIGLDLKDCGRR